MPRLCRHARFCAIKLFMRAADAARMRFSCVVCLDAPAAARLRARRRRSTSFVARGLRVFSPCCLWFCFTAAPFSRHCSSFAAHAPSAAAAAMPRAADIDAASASDAFAVRHYDSRRSLPSFRFISPAPDCRYYASLRHDISLLEIPDTS